MATTWREDRRVVARAALAEEYAVLRQAGTERAFTGAYTDTETVGIYSCKACGASSSSPTPSSTPAAGGPSFYQPISDTIIEYLEDDSHGMKHVEVRCATCGSHLGVFPDGYGTPTGDRYCINSISLTLEPADQQPDQQPDQR